MKKIKIILDSIMLIIMITLMKIIITGLQLHEILGLALFIIFIIHKIFNSKWVMAVGKNFFNKNMKIKSKIMFILDIVIFVFVLLNVITGISISKFVLTNVIASNIAKVAMLHKFFAWWSLIMISIHIGFHWENIVNYLERRFRVLKENQVFRIFFIVIYIIIAIMGMYSLSRSSIYSKLIPIMHNERGMNDGMRDYNKFHQYKKRGFKNWRGKQGNQNDCITEENDSDIPTLDEYLDQFTCSGCRRQCPLLRPSCRIGEKEREEKIQEYYQKYGKRTNIDNLSSIEGKNKYRNRTNIISIISIIWSFVGGTYYINKIIRLRKSKNL